MNKARMKVGSIVESTRDLRLGLSDGVDIPMGTIGTIKEVNRQREKSCWLHVHWVTDYGTRPRNCYPAEVVVIK